MCFLPYQKCTRTLNLSWVVLTSKKASNEKTPARDERGLEDSSFNFDEQYVEYESYYIILNRVDNFRLRATSTESAEVFRDIEEVEIAVAVDVCSRIICVERTEEC